MAFHHFSFDLSQLSFRPVFLSSPELSQLFPFVIPSRFPLRLPPLQWTATVTTTTTMPPAPRTAKTRSWSSLKSRCRARRAFATRRRTSANSSRRSRVICRWVDATNSLACQTRRRAALSLLTVKVLDPKVSVYGIGKFLIIHSDVLIFVISAEQAAANWPGCICDFKLERWLCRFTAVKLEAWNSQQAEKQTDLPLICVNTVFTAD